MKMQIEDPSGESYSVDGEFIEPIHLQVVCQRWWKNRLDHGNNKKQTVQLGDLTDVDKALEDFYLEAVRKAISLDAIRFTGVNERDIREWCGKKLITSSGTRGIVHRGSNYTDGMNNKVVDVLADEHLIRREWRAGSIWYELTHDRLIKPIKDSNKPWKHEQELKSKKSFRLRIAIPIIGAAVILTLVALSQYSAYSQPCSAIESQAIVPIGGSPYGIDVNPNTNMIYVANYANDVVSVIDGKKNSVIQNITVGLSPTSVAVNPNTNMIYVANYDSSSVSAIDGKTNHNIGNKSIYGTNKCPLTLDIDLANQYIFVLDECSNRITVIDDAGRDEDFEYPLIGKTPNGIAFNTNANTIYVTDLFSNTLYTSKVSNIFSSLRQEAQRK